MSSPIMLLADLTNVSGSPVRVTGVQLAGTGLGRILAIRSNDISPLGAPLRTTPAGIFRVRGPRRDHRLPTLEIGGSEAGAARSQTLSEDAVQTS
jgi:hypothetical protein